MEMAAQAGGIVFQEKVSRLLARGNGRPVLKPNKKLVLGDSVANRRLRKGGENPVVVSQHVQPLIAGYYPCGNSPVSNQ